MYNVTVVQENQIVVSPPSYEVININYRYRSVKFLLTTASCRHWTYISSYYMNNKKEKKNSINIIYTIMICER